MIDKNTEGDLLQSPISILNKKLDGLFETSDAKVDQVTRRRLDNLVASRNRNIKDITMGKDPNMSAKDFEKEQSKLVRHYRLRFQRDDRLKSKQELPSKSKDIMDTPMELDDKQLLQQIIDLGWKDFTGPKQTKDGTVMLKGTKTGRGYRIEPIENNQYRAVTLNNYGVSKDGSHSTIGPYRTGKEICTGTKEQCLQGILDNAKQHLQRVIK